MPPRPWSSSAAAGPRPTAAASSDDAPMDASPGRDDAVLSIGALLAPPSVVDVVTQLLGSIVLRGTPSPAPPARTDAAASDGGAGGDDVQSLAARLGAVSLTPTPAEALPAATPPVALVWSTEMELHAGPGAHVERPERHAAVVRRPHPSGAPGGPPGPRP